MKALPNQITAPNCRQALQLLCSRFIERWIRWQRPSPAAVGEFYRWPSMRFAFVILCALMTWMPAIAADSTRTFVYEKLARIRLAKINMDKAPLHEALDFLKDRIVTDDPAPDPSQRGMSVIIQLRPIDATGPDRMPPEPTITYKGAHVLWIDALAAIAIQADLDVYVTSVGVVVVRRGDQPFRKDDVRTGEIYEKIPARAEK